MNKPRPLEDYFHGFIAFDVFIIFFGFFAAIEKIISFELWAFAWLVVVPAFFVVLVVINLIEKYKYKTAGGK